MRESASPLTTSFFPTADETTTDEMATALPDADDPPLRLPDDAAHPLDVPATEVLPPDARPETTDDRDRPSATDVVVEAPLRMEAQRRLIESMMP
jgi:hypothetical protein